MLNSEEISVDRIKSGIGGYKKKATKEFVDAVRNDYEALCKENLELKDKLAVLSEGVQYYKNMEKSLQKALVLAERTTSETMHAAEVKAVAMEKEAKARADVVKKEAKMEADTYEKEAAAKAEKMIREAKEQADTAIAEGNEELRRIHSQIMSLIQQYEQYKAQYKQLAMAQMNVLESEAYNLEAPILKTLQFAVEQDKKQEKAVSNKSKNSDEHEVVKPVHPVQPVSEQQVPASEEEQREKKVYVDARGKVVEVHEFREVTIPFSGPDPFAENTNEIQQDDMELFKNNGNVGVERFDDEEGVPVPEVNKESVEDTLNLHSSNGNVEELSRGFESGNRDFNASFTDLKRQDKNVNSIGVQSYEEVVPNQTVQSENNQNPEQERVSAATMREIERMQLERLRREEEKHTEELRQAQARKAYFSVGSTMDTATEKTQEQDFYQNVTFGNEKPEVSLREIKQQEDEQNSKVPLPKASDENKYFSSEQSFANPDFYAQTGNESSEEDNMPVIDQSVTKISDSEEEVLRQSKETESSFFRQVMNSKSEKGGFFEQFSDEHSDDYSKVPKEEDRNSLDFELDFNNGMPLTQDKDGGFKSFRDFESEL